MPDHQVGIVLADQLFMERRHALHTFATPRERLASFVDRQSGYDATAVHMCVEEGEAGTREGVAHRRSERSGDRVADQGDRFDLHRADRRGGRRVVTGRGGRRLRRARRQPARRAGRWRSLCNLEVRIPIERVRGRPGGPNDDRQRSERHRNRNGTQRRNGCG